MASFAFDEDDRDDARGPFNRSILDVNDSNGNGLERSRSVSIRKRLGDLSSFLVSQVSFQPWEDVSKDLAPLSLRFLPVGHWLRKPLIRLIRWRPFEWLMLLVILANCATLAMQSSRPGFSESSLGQNLMYSDYFFIAAFASEMVVKVIALGFVSNEHSYLRSGWNVLDFIVVIVGFLQLSSSVGNHTAIRALRVLRPLRLITKIEALKLIVTAVIKSLPMLKDVAILWIFFFIICSVICLQLFMGKLYNRCGQPTYVNSTVNGINYTSVSYAVNTSSYVNTNQVCKGPMVTDQTWPATSSPPDYSSYNPAGGKSWGYSCPSYPSDNPNDLNYPDGLFCIPYANPVYGQRNFDNIFYTWMAVFQHVLPQDWSSIMYDTQASVSWWTWLLHVTMAIVGGILISNLIVAILFINFSQNYSLSDKNGGTGLRLRSSFGGSRVYTPRHSLTTPKSAWAQLRLACYKIQRHVRFEQLSMSIIILNAIILGIVWYPDMPLAVDKTTSYLNYMFTFYFLFEMILRLLGLGLQGYVSDNFNIFDGLVTILGVIEVSLDIAPNVSGQPFLSSLRAFRLIRIFRLVRSWSSLRKTMQVFLLSIKSVGWLTLLLVLFLFIFGLLGMSFFGFNLDQCPVTGSTQLCPPGLTWRDCPAHFDCYIPCDSSQVYQWLNVPGSPYGGQAYCEAFPRRDPSTISPAPPPIVQNSSNSPPPQPPPGPPAPPFSVTDYTYSVEALMLSNATQFWAQVGKPTTFQPNYDDVYQGIISIFVMLTADNYDTNMKLTMVLTNQWLAALFTISIMIVGIYIVLNLFLAILLANLDQVVDDPLCRELEDNPDPSGHYPTNAVVPWPPLSRHGSVINHHKMDEEERSASYHNAVVVDFWHLPNSHKAQTLAYSEHGAASGQRMWIDEDSLNDLQPSPLSSPAHHEDDFKPQPPWSKIDDDVNTKPGDYSQSRHLGNGPIAEGIEDESSSIKASPVLNPHVSPTVTPREHASDAHDAPQHFPGSSAPIDSMKGTALDRALFSDPGLRRGNNNIILSPSNSSAVIGLKNWVSGNIGARLAKASGASNWKPPSFISSILSSFGLTGTDHETELLRGAYLQQVLRGRSLFLFGGLNPFRRYLAKVIVSTWFDTLCIVLIALSSLELCFDDAGVEPGSKKAQAIFVLDMFFTITFGIEAAMKIIVLGFAFNGKSSYMRDTWNVIDFIVVVVGILTLALDSILDPSTIVWLRALRALRALRPIKIAARVTGVRVVVSAIISAMPAVGEILMVALLFYYIFGVLSVNLLGGILFYCRTSSSLTFPFLDPYYLTASGNINKSWCQANGGSQNISASYYHSSIGVQVPTWQLSDNNWGANGNVERFDNVIMALFVLFQVATLENWSPIMYNSMTATYIDEQPLSGGFPLVALFFIFFVLFCVFFILNMVIGVSINAFNRQKVITGRSAMLTDRQQEWLTLQRMIASTAPTKKHQIPISRVRKWFFDRVMSNMFDLIIIVFVFLNVIVMFLQHKGQSEAWTIGLSAANAAFTGIYFLEMLAKWLAIGFKQYFSNSWCIFDFVVVVVSVIGVIVDYTGADKGLAFLPLLRAFRVLRVIKIIPKAKGLRMMILTLYWCIPSLINVGSVFFLVMFIYAIIGMNLFGMVKLQQNYNSDANFQTFPSAMMLLFRMTMGENWNNVMIDCMIQEQCILVTGPTPLQLNASAIGAGTGNYTVWPGTYLDSIADALVLSQIPSDQQQISCSPSPAITAIYFETYMLLVTYLLLQLVIGIIIENIEHFVAIDSMQITQDHIQAFVTSWEHLDNEGTGFIHANKVTALLSAIPTPMGVKDMDRAPLRVQEIVQTVNIPLRRVQAHFVEVLHALTWRVSGIELPANTEYTIHTNLVNRLPKDDLLPKYSVGNYYAALKVQTYVRGYLFRMKLSRLISEIEETEAAEGRVPSHIEIGEFVHRELSREASRLVQAPSVNQTDGAIDTYEGEDTCSPSLANEPSQGLRARRLRKKFRDSRGSRSLTREQKRDLLWMVSKDRGQDDSPPAAERTENALGSDRRSHQPFSSDQFDKRSDSPFVNVSAGYMSPHTSNRTQGVSDPSPHTSDRFKAAAQLLASSQPPQRPSEPGYFWPVEEKPKATRTPRTSQSGAAPMASQSADRPSQGTRNSLLRLFGGKREAANDPSPPLSMLLETLAQESAIIARSQDPNELPLAEDSMDFVAVSSSLRGSSPPQSPLRDLKKLLSIIPEALDAQDELHVANAAQMTASPSNPPAAESLLASVPISPTLATSTSRVSRTSRAKLPPLSKNPISPRSSQGGE